MRNSRIRLLGSHLRQSELPVAPWDLSGDGALDIVFSGASSAGDRLLGYVVTDLSGGSLAGAATRIEGDPGASVLAGTMGDFDGDGASDLALSVGCEPNEVVVFRGPLAAGTLTPADADVRIANGSCGGYDGYVRSMESGDLDGDGRDDLVMGFNNAVGVLAGGGL